MPIGTVDTPANEVSGVAEAAEADETVTVVAIPVPGGIEVIALVAPSFVIVKAVDLLVTTALTGMDNWIPADVLSIWTDVVPSVFSVSALTAAVMGGVVVVVVVVVVGGDVVGSVLTHSIAG